MRELCAVEGIVRELCSIEPDRGPSEGTVFHR